MPVHAHAPLPQDIDALHALVRELRNYGCFGTPEAGSLAAVVYSLTATCGLLGVNPEAYFNWVLPRLAEGTNQSTTQGLLPHDYAAMIADHRKNK